jgi:hypothetical protein
MVQRLYESHYKRVDRHLVMLLMSLQLATVVKQNVH